MVTTTTVVHSYFHLSRMHEVVELDPLLAPTVIPEAPPAQLLAPWDFPMSHLRNVEMDPMSPGLPSMEILPQPTV